MKVAFLLGGAAAGQTPGARVTAVSSYMAPPAKGSLRPATAGCRAYLPTYVLPRIQWADLVTSAAVPYQ